jgi:hypothetical protein
MLRHWQIGHRGYFVIALLLVLLGLAAGAARIVKKYQTPGPPDGINEGYCDFHNGIYFPSLALLNGESPYGAQYAAEYPVSRQIPFFSPAIVALHAPLSLLPLRVSEVLYFGIMVALIVAIAWQSLLAAGIEKRLDYLLFIAAGIIFSRAGHVTIFNGYFTFELVLAVIIAIRYAEARPWLAAFALVIVSAKPTYILPLGFLMLARGNLKSLIIGAILSIIAAVVPLGWLAHHEGKGDIAKGLSEIRQQISDSQEVHHQEPNELPVLSWTRVDIFAIYAKWTDQDPGDLAHLGVMFLILAIPLGILFKRMRAGVDDGVAGLTGAIIMTGMIVALYRQSYDVLLLAPPIVGALGCRLESWKYLSAFTRYALILLMLFPAFNYLSTQMVLGRFDLSTELVRILTSVNAIVLAVILVWVCSIAFRLPESIHAQRPERSS